MLTNYGGHCFFSVYLFYENAFIPFRPSGTSAKHSVLFAKNDSPNRFLNAQTVLKEIKAFYQLSMLTNYGGHCFFIIYVCFIKNAFIPFRPSGTSAKHSVLVAKNDSPNRFLNAQTVLKEIKFLLYFSALTKVGAVFYMFLSNFVFQGAKLPKNKRQFSRNVLIFLLTLICIWIIIM